MVSLINRINLAWMILTSFVSISLAFTSSGTVSSTSSIIVPTSPSLIVHANATKNASITADHLSLTNYSTSTTNETALDDSSEIISMFDEKDESKLIVEETSDDVALLGNTSENTNITTTTTTTTTNEYLEKESDVESDNNNTMIVESKDIKEDDNINMVGTILLDPNGTITKDEAIDLDQNSIIAVSGNQTENLKSELDTTAITDKSISFNTLSLNENASNTDRNESNPIHLPEDEASHNESQQQQSLNDDMDNTTFHAAVDKDKAIITMDTTKTKKKRRRKKRKLFSTTATDEATESNNSSTTTLSSNNSINVIVEVSDHENATTLNLIDATNTTKSVLEEDITSPPETSSAAIDVDVDVKNIPTIDNLTNDTKDDETLSQRNVISSNTINITIKADDETSMLSQTETNSIEEQDTESKTMEPMKRKSKKSKRSKRTYTTPTTSDGDTQKNPSLGSKKRKRTKKRKASLSSSPVEKEDLDESSPSSDDSDDEDFTDLLNLPESEKKKLSNGMEEEPMEETLNDISLNDLFEHSDDEEQNDTHHDTVAKSLESTDIESAVTMKKSTQAKIDSNISNGIRVSAVTWNLAETAPEPSDAAFLRHLVQNPKYNQRDIETQSPDIVLIGGQECENTKPRRSEGHRSRLFRSLAVKNLGRDYVPLAIHSLGGVQCLLFCHRRLHPYIDLVNVADVACGVGNVFHNKGAVGVYVQVRPKEGGQAVKMLFVAAHLAAHVKNIQARNDDFWRILAELEMKSPPRFLPPKTRFEVSERRNKEEGRGDLSSGADISMGDDTGYGGRHLLDSMDHIFFCGDLNYRVDLPREYTEKILQEEKKDGSTENEDLLMYDQLLSVISRSDAFPNFHEGKITFAPTFKFDKGTRTYDTSYKQRIPAWTDRILFKHRSSSNGKANGFGVNVLQYDCAGEATHSDHRPVFGTYLIGMGNGGEAPEEQSKRKKKRNRRKKKGSASKNDELN